MSGGTVTGNGGDRNRAGRREEEEGGHIDGGGAVSLLAVAEDAIRGNWEEFVVFRGGGCAVAEYGIAI